jgi:hypothetical protein
MVEIEAVFLSVDKSRESMPYDTGVIVEEIAKMKNINNIKLGKKIYGNTKKFFF